MNFSGLVKKAAPVLQTCEGIVLGQKMRPGVNVRFFLRQHDQTDHRHTKGHAEENRCHAADPDLVPLGCAIPSAELLAAGRLDRFLARAARTRGKEYNIYTEPRGDAALRTEISRRAARWGQALHPSDIAVTCGCTEALSLALRAVTRRGDIVAIESPTYFGLLQVLESLELKALELPTNARDGLQVDALERALKSKPVKA